MEHSPHYIEQINLSLRELQDIKGCYSARMKGQEVRGIIARMKRALSCGQRISRLHIRLKNVKSVAKIAGKLPNVCKMSLVELKTIDWGRLQTMGQDLHQNSPSKTSLVCIGNLQSYVHRVSNETLVFIFDKIKQTLEGFDANIYEELIRNFIVISPSTPL